MQPRVPDESCPYDKLHGIDGLGWFNLIVEVARRAERELGGLGPFSPEEVGALVSNAFIGAESLFLLGVEKKGSPVREALRRVGDLIRIAERASSKR